MDVEQSSLELIQRYGSARTGRTTADNRSAEGRSPPARRALARNQSNSLMFRGFS